MWRHARVYLEKLLKIIPAKEVWLYGSFTMKKTRPGDMDLVFIVKTKEKNKKAHWSIDLTVVPDNLHGRAELADVDKWVNEKYGRKKSMMVRIK